MAYALYHDLVRQDPVKDEVRIGKNSDPPKATPADPAAGVWMRRDELDHGVDAALEVTSAQQRMIIDMGEDIL